MVMAERFWNRSEDAPVPQGGGAAVSDARASVMAEALRVAGDLPTPQPRSVLCPFCGSVTPGADRCAGCGGRFDPLSRQATQNHMGPWFVRDEGSPHRPGCTYETMMRMVDGGQVGLDSVIRGPSTRQFWMLARHAPGVAHRLGVCHNCRASVARDAFQCPECHAGFSIDRDRQHLGLGPARPLPGQGPPEVLAMHAGPAPARGDIPRDLVAGEPSADRVGAGPGVEATDDIVGHARSRVARYREEARKDRQRGVIALVLASLVVVMSLAYAGLVGGRRPAEVASVGIDGSNTNANAAVVSGAGD